MVKNNKILEKGEVFGKLVVCECLGRIHYPKDSHWFYRVKCSCGNEFVTSGTCLKTGGKTMCQKCSRKILGILKKNKIKIGDRFERLVVLSEEGKISKNSNHYYYLVKCDCGKEEIVRGTLLKNKNKTMCKNCYTKLSKNYKHGLTDTRLFHIWQGMNARCHRKTSHAYELYGKRGIKVCDDWRNDFIAFYKWAIENGYREDLTIDRIDVNGDYTPSNCRWADRITQANNVRNNRIVEFRGEKHTLAEWSRITGIEYYNIKNRINKYGWGIEKALTTPALRNKK